MLTIVAMPPRRELPRIRRRVKRTSAAVTSQNAPSSQSNANTESQALVVWGTPAPVVYGTPLSATQLNATASLPGSFVYSPPLGTVLAAGRRR